MRVMIYAVILMAAIINVNATEPETKAVKTTTQIEGKVVDKLTGEALVGVCLTMKESGIKTYSDLEGKFEIQGVDPGIYEIEIDYLSYKTVTLKDVTANTPEVKVKVELEAVSK